MNEAEYQAALAELARLLDEDDTLLDRERIAELAPLVEAYERKHYPIPMPDPIDAIQFRMEQQGLKAADLVPYIGRLNRVYEVLNRKRGLSLAMIRKLHAGLGIPAEVLIQPIRREPAP